MTVAPRAIIWGLGGFCRGSTLTALGLGASGTLAFVPAMIAGMWAGACSRRGG